MEPSEYQPLSPVAHAYIEGRLGPAQERAFERELERDHDLRRRVGEVRQARKLLGGVALLEPPQGFDERLQKRLHSVDLAREARGRLTRAPRPLWQSLSWLAASAAAAAIAVAVVIPGSEPAGDNAAPMLAASTVQVSSEELLPLVSDHHARFLEFRRAVAFAEHSDARRRREIVSGELAVSGLADRSRRLLSLAEHLPLQERGELVPYLGELCRACDAVEHELSESRSSGRDVELAGVSAALDSVKAPGGLAGDYVVTIRSRGTQPSLRASRVSAGHDPEMASYQRAREAFYDRDYARAAQLFDAYLLWFQRGGLRQQALAWGCTAHLRAGNQQRAVELFAQNPPRELFCSRDFAELARLAKAGNE